ncbi:barstar family protein [Streptomyces sp. NBC_01465]|uniref:barstar family protein n=1 Tax=Streptomyces sp. NBC_01465 TaxID=2903878 RepID=UPI002E3556C9|nr:barstar family protein [Streptomyces sp. NBC_01465]
MLTIDVSSVVSEDELHGLLQREFDFPSFYGGNWDAFWDAVTGLVEIPGHVRFLGWDSLLEHVPSGGRMLRRQLDNYRNRYRPDLLVEYVQGRHL